MLFPRPSSTAHATATDAAQQRIPGRDPEQVIPLGWGPFYRGIPMERTLIAVEPDERGWCIRIAGVTLEHNLGKRTALEKASGLARERHTATGVPTGVHVRMLCGDGVMVDAHG
jgi:hypothetical protein